MLIKQAQRDLPFPVKRRTAYFFQGGLPPVFVQVEYAFLLVLRAAQNFSRLIYCLVNPKQQEVICVE